MSKPVVGIIEYPYEDKDGDMIYEVLTPIIESISKAGARPVGIFPTQIANFQEVRLRNIPDLTFGEKKDIVSSIKMCDAIIKPGALKLFGFDRFIYAYAFKNNIPYLGICAGMQIMAAHGKEKIENKKIEYNGVEHKSKEKYVHKIKLYDSKLKDIIGKDCIMVNSKHAYAIKDSGVHKVSAIAEDGVIEAIENPYCDFNIGLQWHPELITDDENSNKIFNRFVDAAEEYSYKKRKKTR